MQINITLVHFLNICNNNNFQNILKLKQYKTKNIKP